VEQLKVVKTEMLGEVRDSVQEICMDLERNVHVHQNMETMLLKRRGSEMGEL